MTSMSLAMSSGTMEIVTVKGSVQTTPGFSWMGLNVENCARTRIAQ